MAQSRPPSGTATAIGPEQHDLQALYDRRKGSPLPLLALLHRAGIDVKDRGLVTARYETVRDLLDVPEAELQDELFRIPGLRKPSARRVVRQIKDLRAKEIDELEAELDRNAKAVWAAADSFRVMQATLTGSYAPGDKSILDESRASRETARAQYDKTKAKLKNTRAKRKMEPEMEPAAKRRALQEERTEDCLNGMGAAPPPLSDNAAEKPEPQETRGPDLRVFADVLRWYREVNFSGQGEMHIGRETRNLATLHAQLKDIKTPEALAEHLDIADELCALREQYRFFGGRAIRTTRQ